LEALATAVLLLVSCQFLVPFCLYRISADLFAWINAEPGPPHLLAGTLSPVLQLIQALLMMGLVLVAATLRVGRVSEVLSLKLPFGGFSTTINVAGTVFLTMVLLNVGLSMIFGGNSGFAHEPLPGHAGWLRATWPWVNFATLTVAVPMAEEMLFRGFLLSALARSRLGFWGGAVVVDMIWTLAHVPWSLATVLSHFMFGLLLSFAIWRTGSLWSCVLAHSMNNAVPALFRLIYVGS
jgi:membrane protease YdiL (CAAX protease family)